MAEIEKDHFWFVGRRKLVMGLLKEALGQRKGRLLDLGCGTGYFSWLLGKLGHELVGLDGQPEGLFLARERDSNGSYLLSNAEYLPFRNESFDAIIACDVLEHLDDIRSLAEVYRVLKRGGKVIITVPAHPWLWSLRDELAGHRRRYRSEALRQMLHAADFQILSWTPYQCMLFPFVVLSRYLGRGPVRTTELEEMPGSVLNRTLTAISIFETQLSKFIRMPWGSSFVLLAEKR